VKDTPDHVARRYEAMLLALPPGRRVAMALRMFGTARALAEAGLRAGGVTNPREIRRRLILAFYGDELTPPEIDAIVAGVAGAATADNPY
jgi:hypothetical protein